MSSVTKNAIIKAIIGDVLTELMVKTNVENVFISEDVTLADKLAEIVTAVNLRPKSTDVTAEIQTAINGLIDGAPEAYDTLKEISAYISAHADVVTSLNAAIGNKADKSTVNSITNTINSLGTLAKKSTVSESDLDSNLRSKIASAVGSGGGSIHVGTTKPSNMTANDLFFQIQS